MFGDNDKTMDGPFIGSRSFIQFEDISAKCSISATVNGNMALADVAELGVTDGKICKYLEFSIVWAWKRTF